MNRRQPAWSIEQGRLEQDLQDFRLFASAKLNLGKDTARHYTSRVRAFLKDRAIVSDKDVQAYIQDKKEKCSPDYVSNIISSFKAFFRDFKGLAFMNGYKHPSGPLKMKEEIEPEKVKRFIEAIDDITVRCITLLLATSGLRKSEVWNLTEKDIDKASRCIIPHCHSGETKHSGISFYNEEAESCLKEYERQNLRHGERFFVLGHTRFLKAWNNAREESGIYLKPKDMRDFFSQELGKALIPDRYIDIFQGRAPKSVLAKHYTPQGIKLLKRIYAKARLKVLT